MMLQNDTGVITFKGVDRLDEGNLVFHLPHKVAAMFESGCGLSSELTEFMEGKATVTAISSSIATVRNSSEKLDCDEEYLLVEAHMPISIIQDFIEVSPLFSNSRRNCNRSGKARFFSGVRLQVRFWFRKSAHCIQHLRER